MMIGESVPYRKVMDFNDVIEGGDNNEDQVEFEQNAPGLEKYELAGKQTVELVKELKAISGSENRRRDIMIAASQGRYRKNLDLERNEHWDIQYELIATLSSATKLTDLERQSVDNRIAMEIVQIGPEVKSNLAAAKRRAMGVQSQQGRVEREGMKQIIEEGCWRSLAEEQLKKKGIERSLEKQMQMSQLRASLANVRSKSLQEQVQGASVELAASYQFCNDLTDRLLARQQQVLAAFIPIRNVEKAKEESRERLAQLEKEAARTRKELQRQHLDLFRNDKPADGETPEQQPPELAINPTALFFDSLNQADPSAITSAAVVADAPLNVQLEEVESRMAKASWGVAIIKASMQTAMARLEKVKRILGRITAQANITDVDVITERFAEAAETALRLYDELGKLRDQVAAEKAIEGTIDHGATPTIAERNRVLERKLAESADAERAVAQQMGERRSELDCICIEVGNVFQILKIPSTMMTISDLNLFESIGSIETHVHSLLNGDQHPPSHSVIVQDPTALKCFDNLNTYHHRRARTIIESRDLDGVLAEN